MKNMTKFMVFALALGALGTMAVSAPAADTTAAYNQGRADGAAKGKQAAIDDQPADEKEESSSGGCCG